MTKEQIFNELKIIFKQIKPNLDIETVTPETRLVEDLGLDSLTILLMSFAIEKRFQFRFDGVKRFNDVGEVTDYIEEHVR